MPTLITPPELAQKLKTGKIYLLDCREPWEAQRASIHRTTALVPLTTWPQATSQIKPGKDEQLVVYCHHGVRSFRAAQTLEQMGYACVFSLVGGIDAWSREIEADVPRY